MGPVQRLLAGGMVQSQPGPHSGDALGVLPALGPPGLWVEVDTAVGDTGVFLPGVLGEGQGREEGGDCGV